MTDELPSGSNADEWHLYLSRRCDNRAAFPMGLQECALAIAGTIERFQSQLSTVRGETLEAAAKKMDALARAGPSPDFRYAATAIRAMKETK